MISLMELDGDAGPAKPANPSGMVASSRSPD